MAARKIVDDVYSVGAIDWDRKFFDALIPLPRGTSYNSYLIHGTKYTTLIEAVDLTKLSELISNLTQLGINKLDYIVANHAEQDHTGSLPSLLSLFPDAKIVTNSKCREYLIDLLGLAESSFKVIEDRELLDLGGKTLEFIRAPWVHWPETMFTYLREQELLFSCDLFGSHLATSELFARNWGEVLVEAKRYYAQIMMPYAKFVRKHLGTLSSYPMRLIAPSHGPLYDAPEHILSAYSDWASEQARNEVLLLYTSMHGSTERLIEHLTDALIQRGVPVRRFDALTADAGDVAMASVDAATIVFAAPVVLGGPHPHIAYLALLLNALKPKANFVGLVSSYGWGNTYVEPMKALLNNLDAEFLPPVCAKGLPKDEHLREIEVLADSIQTRHRQVAA